MRLTLLLCCVVSCLVTAEAKTTLESANTQLTGQGRIVGGFPAAEGQWPWQVAIFKRRSIINNYRFTCGGILIGKNWVLSAAHCFEESDIIGLLLRFGVHDLLNPSINTVERFADSYRNHEGYNPTTFEADISLLHFKEDLSFNYFIQPVGLPSASTTVTPGQSCTVSGFGETQGTGTSFSVMRYAQVAIISLSTCNDWYSDVSLTVTDDHVCAGYEEGGVDTCQGDSGGPLVCLASDDSSLYVVQGITSYGFGCATRRKPGAYTKVQSYSDWIAGITNLTTGTGIARIPNSGLTTHNSTVYLWFILMGIKYIVCQFYIHP